MEPTLAIAFVCIGLAGFTSAFLGAPSMTLVKRVAAAGCGMPGIEVGALRYATRSAVTWAVAGVAIALSTSTYGDVRSAPVGGVLVWIHGPVRCDEPIRYGFMPTNPVGPVIFFPLEDYYCRAALRDASGREVPAKGLARKLGRKFGQLKQFSPWVIQWQERRGTDPRRPMGRHLFSDRPSGEEFPSPEKMFDIPGPRQYELKLQFAVFVQTQQGTNLARTLVLLPPVDVPVTGKKQ